MKLKVLFMATRDWYHPATTGGDMTMWENARYLASVGHDVTFVAAGYAGSPKTELLDGIRVVRLGGIHSLWFRTFVRYVSQWRGHYDVVVAEGFGGSRIPRMTPLYVKEPIITEWHQVHRDLFAVQYPRLLNGPLNLLERTTAWIHRNTLVRAGTDEWREAFTKIGFRPENIFVVPVSIREEWIASSTPPPQPSPASGEGGRISSSTPPPQPSPASGEGGRISSSTPPPALRATSPASGEGDEPTVLWLGKLRRYKCPDHAVRAMVEVVRSVPRARLTIAGRRDDARYERQLRALVTELHLESNVEFRFDISEQEKRDLLHASRVLVLPSAVEGFGIVVLEANACGVPVVASTGVPEGAVGQGGNGLRYPFGQLDALSQRLVEILTDDGLCEQLSNNSVEFASHFGWRQIGAQYEAVLQKAVEDRQASRIAHPA